MAGKITALKQQKHDKRRVNVYVDGEFAFGLAEIEAVSLRVGDWLSDERIAELKAGDAIEKARDKALNYLSYRPRSEWELRHYLRDKEFDDDVIDLVLGRLRRADLVDDLEFARYWIENRLRFRPRGRWALKQELRQKRINTGVIEKALVDFDEAEALKKAVQRHARRLQHLPSEKFQRRLIQRLARRGFSYGDIRDALETYLSSDDDA